MSGDQEADRTSPEGRWERGGEAVAPLSQWSASPEWVEIVSGKAAADRYRKERDQALARIALDPTWGLRPLNTDGGVER